VTCTDRSGRELLTQGRPLFLGIVSEVAAHYREQERVTESFEIFIFSRTQALVLSTVSYKMGPVSTSYLIVVQMKPTIPELILLVMVYVLYGRCL